MALSPESRPGYRADIDGLRAVALALVVGFHAFPETLRSGFIGVDIFFVISGFLITGLLMQAQQQGRFSFRDFYLRRARRLLPALLTVLAASWAFGFVALLPSEFAQLGRHMLAAATFSSNFVYWHEAGYFDPDGALKPLLHLWSLAIEEQFYLLFPLLLWLCWRRRRSPEALVLLLLVASLALNFLLREWRMADFYLPLTRWWELLVGAALAFATTAPSPTRLRWVWVPGVMLLGAGVYFITGAMLYPGALALLPVLGAALLIAAGPRGHANRVLAWRPFVLLGRVSYPLYLWHWPLLSYAHIIAPEALTAPQRAALLLAALLLSIATYQWIERPLRFGAKRRERAMLLTLVLLGALGLGTHLAGGIGARPAANYIDNRAELLRLPEQDTACARYLGMEKPPVDYCRYRDAGGARTVALVGDSFAHVAFPGMADALAARGVNTLLLATPACPAYLQPQNIRDQCAKDARMALRTVAARRDIDRVFFFARGSSYVSGDRQFHTHPRFPGPYFLSTQQAAIDLLVGAGKRVLVVMENPHTAVHPQRCIPRPLRHITHECRVAQAWVEEGEAEFRQWAAQLQRAALIDPMPAFCDGEHCRLFEDGVLLYADDAHVSQAGSRYLAQKVLAPYLD